MAAVTPSMLAVTVSVLAICSPAWSMAALARSISRSPRSRRPATAAEVSDISRAAFSMTYTATPTPTTKATTATQTAVSMPESPPARPYRLDAGGQGAGDEVTWGLLGIGGVPGPWVRGPAPGEDGVLPPANTVLAFGDLA